MSPEETETQSWPTMDVAIDSYPERQQDPVREKLYKRELLRTRDPQGRHKEPAAALVRELLGEIRSEGRSRTAKWQRPPDYPQSPSGQRVDYEHLLTTSGHQEKLTAVLSHRDITCS